MFYNILIITFQALKKHNDLFQFIQAQRVEQNYALSYFGMWTMILFSFGKTKQLWMLPPLQIIRRFDFCRYIIFTMYLVDIVTYISRKAKTSYNLEWREYLLSFSINSSSYHVGSILQNRLLLFVSMIFVPFQTFLLWQLIACFSLGSFDWLHCFFLWFC